VPLAIDEFPALFIAAACARGRTVLRGAEELRVKESDRIAAMAEGLTTLGIANEVLEDGIIIEGGTLGGGVIHTYHDHRIAMSFAIAALCAESEISVLDCDHVATSFPGFDSLARGLGLQISTLAD
jgi:3-phosphoshikimate 1-carboxyvinyltransferase